MASSGEPSGDGGRESRRHWLPIESNPEVMNAYAEKLGFPTPLYRFHDLLSTEEWALEMIPRPAIAALMLFPIKPVSEEHAAAEAARIAEAGQTVSSRLWYSKQTIPNACGTIGILHAVANTSTLTGGDIELREDSFFHRYISGTRDKTPEQRAAELEEDDDIDAEHGEVVGQGQSAVVEDTWNHFIAFVEKDGQLYEMDGRKAGPINHGPTSRDTLLQDAVRVMREFMDRDPGELRFTMVALAAAAEPDVAA